MSLRTVRRGGALLAITVLVTVLAGCQNAKVGAKCNTTDFGQDSTHVLSCVKGKWKRLMTKGEAAKILFPAPTTTVAPTAPAAPVVTVAPETTTAPATTVAPVTTTTTMPTTTAPPVVATAASVWVGENSSCAIMSDTGVKCWGKNDKGQLGDGTTTNRTAAVTVPGLTGVTQISGNNGSTCALLSNQTVKCWGEGSLGQLGDGTATDRLTPTTVSGLTGVTQISGGIEHTCALAGTAVMCWGDNGFGQLGDGTTTGRNVPTVVPALAAASSIAAGTNNSCAVIAADGSVKCWGDNHYGQLGNGTTVNLDPPAPVTVTGLTGISRVSIGGGHACALVANDGSVKCWGDNYYGQLGNGTYGALTGSLTPTAVVGLTGAGKLDSASDSNCVLASGKVSCWGDAYVGQLGRDIETDKTLPGFVDNLSGVNGFASGTQHGCAIVGTAVKCWGFNGSGQLGDGSTTTRLAPVSVTGLS